MNVGVIAELNPPHIGHQYLFDSIRKQFGEDTTITVILSSDFTQRGDLACISLYNRAKMAVLMGADLVVELPIPWSSSTAEYFAHSGVFILEQLHCIDTLAFGIEECTLKDLQSIVDFMDSQLFLDLFASFKDSFRNLSYIQLRTKIIEEHLGAFSAELSTKPNNILALEYLRALKHSTIQPFAFLRQSKLGDIPSISAHRIRDLLANNQLDTVTSYVPLSISSLLFQNYSSYNLDALMPLLFREVQECTELPFDVSKELFAHLKKALYNTKNYTELLDFLVSKNTTLSHAKRAIWSVLFHLPSNLSQKPSFARFLAASSKGLPLLSSVLPSFVLLSKPADFKRILEKNSMIEQQNLLDKVFYADQLACILRTGEELPDAPFKKSPFILDES